ncbi:Transcriptional regulator, DeoR family [Klebsiella pneumoniae ISC21]|nr:Transcriptional regulator, DeoR family [Klebsiella pneumoniae ISC21]
MLAILPEARRRQAEQTRLFAPDLGAHRYAKTHLTLSTSRIQSAGITASLPG